MSGKIDHKTSRHQERLLKAAHQRLLKRLKSNSRWYRHDFVSNVEHKHPPSSQKSAADERDTTTGVY